MPKYLRTAETPAVVKDQFGFSRSVAKNQEVETFTILKDGWTKTSDAPYYAIGKTIGVVTSPTIVEDLLGYEYLEITALVNNISVKANSEANPNSLSLSIGSPFIVDNRDNVVDSLIFAGAGDVIVTGFSQ